MDIKVIGRQGLAITGHAIPPTDAVAAAEEWLAARGADPWDVQEARPDMRPTRAWWGGDDVGFVGRDHPAAQPVVVVHLPDGLTADRPVPPAVETRGR